MDRKKFIITSSLAVFGLSTFGKVIRKDDQTFEGDCVTTNDILGPFYRPDSPRRSDLTYAGLEGIPINIMGQVFSSDCITPISEAMIEIWHCNTAGEYDNSSEDFLQRGHLVTDSKGVYSFRTIIPGKYLNGALYRPAHIHYRVTADEHQELISQMYFKGDPNIEEDPWASQPKAEHRILPFIPSGVNGELTVNFDLYLRADS